jgi:hypothetical protein
LPGDHPLYLQSADTKTTTALAIGARAGDFVLWDSGLVHANYAPTSSGVCGKLRRLVAYCAMAPIPAELSGDQVTQLQKARVTAANGAFTTSHWPTAMPKNNHLIYPRSKNFVPLAAPQSCFKENFSSAEQSLVLGQMP